jgi:lipid-binding SYLF domain-containing protein
MGLMLGACVVSGGSAEQKRAAVQEMKNEVLSDLYAEKPDVQQQLNGAPGYAVFSSANINLILASFGGGYGVMHNNGTGQDTYLKMGEFGVGLGAGLKDFRVVMIFHTQDAMDRFTEYGLGFGAQADAAAVASDQGGAVGGELNLDNITVYQLTQTGLALQATIKGTKYWRDTELN